MSGKSATKILNVGRALPELIKMSCFYRTSICETVQKDSEIELFLRRLIASDEK